MNHDKNEMLEKRRAKYKKNNIIDNLKNSKGSLFIAVLLIIVVLLAAEGVIFILIPAIKAKKASIEDSKIVAKEYITVNEGDDNINISTVAEDLSFLQTEAKIDYYSINEPYICGNEIVFSTGETINGSYFYNKIIVYDINTEETHEIEAFDMKYDNFINCLISKNFIVCIDACKSGGGRIIAYDREKEELFAIKDYLFASPVISMYDDIICFMQQTDSDSDKLYVYDLKTREGVCVKKFSSPNSFPTSATISDGRVIYAKHNSEGESTLILHNIFAGSEKSTVLDKYATSPASNGRYTFYLAGEPGNQHELWMMLANGESSMLTDGVLNFKISDDFVAYTKDEAIYIYSFNTKMTYQLTSNLTRGILSSVNGNMVCWYDITSGYGDIDIIEYAEITDIG